MFKNKVALIVGAGASNELGFPLGSQLKGQLQQVLDIRFKDGFRQYSGDVHIVEALREIVRLRGSSDINQLLYGGWEIRDAMPTTGSIDSFLQTHRENAKIVLMGKLGIAKCILKAEAASPLKPKEGEEQIDLCATEGTWYAEFFKMLAEDVRQPENIFKNLAIVSFNYDRSLEHYLFHALMRRFLISSASAAQIMATLEIYHPYGVVGCLPWQDHSAGIPYGRDRYSGDLISIAKELRTFSEGVEDGHVAKIRNALMASAKVLIVGFGFASINMELLKLPVKPTRRFVYATAYDIDPAEIHALENIVARTLSAPADHTKCIAGCTSARLFQVCRVSFSEL